MSHGKIKRSRQQRLLGAPASAHQQRLARGRHLPPHLLTQRKRRGNGRSLLSVLASVILAMFGVMLGLTGVAGIGTAGAYYYFTHDLPSLDEIQTSDFETTKIYDRNWVLLHEVADPKTGWRTKISLEEMSPWVLKGTIAVEDASFYENPGIDPRGIARAIYINTSGIGSSGASTITQQVVRNVLPLENAFEFNYTRKVKEIFLALEFGRRFTKDEILSMYLNEVYYGNRAYGIEAASQVYFGKLAKDLDLAEASMLVGLPQAPSVYDPTRNFSAAKERQAVVLEQMVKQTFITQAEADAASQVDLQSRLRPQQDRAPLAPHFVNYVLGVLEQRYGSEAVRRGGLVIHTTLDYQTQVAAERVVYDHIQTIKARNATNGSLVAIQPWSGQIIAMVGSADYNDQSIDGQVNVAVRERQPGSAFKPISYAAAMMKGWAPSTVIIDSLRKFPGFGGPKDCEGVTKTNDRCYIPENFDFRFNGPVTVRESIGRSLNIPAVLAIQYAGVAETIELAHKMGIKTGLWRGLDFYGLAITLGGGETSPLELAAAYATFSNNGVHVPTTPFIKVTDSSGRVFEEFQPDDLKGQQALTPEVAYMMTDVLKDNSARVRTFGPDSVLNFKPRPAGVKTGSTTDNRDGWTAGYTTELAVAVWVGNSDNSPTNKVDGVVAAGPIWNKFLMEVYTNPELRAHYDQHKTLAGPDGEPLPTNWTRPAGIVEASVCALSGKLPGSGSPTIRDIFAKGTVPTKQCGDFSQEEMKELQEALDALRRYPDRFFPDGRSRLSQLAGIARVGAPRFTPPQLKPAATPRASGAVTNSASAPTVSIPTRAPAVAQRDQPAVAQRDQSPAPTAAQAQPTARPSPPAPPSVAVEVPDVFGLPEDEAQRQIRAAGLATAPPVRQRQADLPPGARVDVVPVGHVLSATPNYGAPVRRGAIVTIAVRAPE